LTQLTGETFCTTIDTVPETVAPDFGDVIVTPPAGVGVGAGVEVGGGVGATVGVEDGAGVGDDPFLTFRVTEALATTVLLVLYPLTEMVCEPFATLLEVQLRVYGGDDATQFPST
jgi:hypothetical protein